MLLDYYKLKQPASPSDSDDDVQVTSYCGDNDSVSDGDFYVPDDCYHNVGDNGDQVTEVAANPE